MRIDYALEVAIELLDHPRPFSPTNRWMTCLVQRGFLRPDPSGYAVLTEEGEAWAAYKLSRMNRDAEILKRYHAGRTVEEIALDMGKKLSTIANVVARHRGQTIR